MTCEFEKSCYIQALDLLKINIIDIIEDTRYKHKMHLITPDKKLLHFNTYCP